MKRKTKISDVQRLVNVTDISCKSCNEQNADFVAVADSRWHCFKFYAFLSHCTNLSCHQKTKMFMKKLQTKYAPEECLNRIIDSTNSTYYEA